MTRVYQLSEDQYDGAVLSLTLILRICDSFDRSSSMGCEPPMGEIGITSAMDEITHAASIAKRMLQAVSTAWLEGAGEVKGDRQ